MRFNQQAAIIGINRKFRQYILLNPHPIRSFKQFVTEMQEVLV